VSAIQAHRIREYRESDARALAACFAALHEFGRALEPRLRPGEDVTAAYLAQMWTRCAEWQGGVFVADVEGRVVGFVTVFTRVPYEELDDPPGEYALVSDLSVVPPYRGRGIGRALLERAEEFARQKGASELRIGVLARNATARELYRRAGFSEQVVTLAKRLSG
jgi:ribosomal protein S18 acetylase RimI-like enzyme